MEPFADVSCVLKVNPQCDACKMKMMQLLSSIIGVYSIRMDAPQGLVKVSGEVDPNRLLNALATTGKHAEVVWTSLQHPQVSRARTRIRTNYHHAGIGIGIGIDNNTNMSSRYNHNYIAPGTFAYYPYAYDINNRRWSDSDPDNYYTYHDQYYCPMTREVPTPEYYYNYHDSRDLPPARYVPSYPPPESDPYQDEPINLCNIM